MVSKKSFPVSVGAKSGPDPMTSLKPHRLLKDLNGSRLPMPRMLKPPTPSSHFSKKRSRSPDQPTNAEKKRRVLNSSSESISSKSSAVKSFNLRKSSSTGNLRASIKEEKPKAIVKPKLNASAKKPITSTVRQTANPVVPVRKVGAPQNSQAVSAVSKKPPPGPGAGGGGGKKRPAWDLKGRLEDMEAKLRQQTYQSSSQNALIEEFEGRIAHLETQKAQLSGAVQQKEELAASTSREVQDLRSQLRQIEDSKDHMRRELERKISELEFNRDSLQRQKESLEGELNATRAEINGLKMTVAQLQSSQAGISAQLQATKEQLDKEISDGKEKDREINMLKETIRQQLAEIEDYNNKCREHETLRRKLHNTIQELKGNIRVFCRVRPLLGEECLGNDGIISHMGFPDPDHKVLELQKVSGDITLNESCLTAIHRDNKTITFPLQSCLTASRRDNKTIIFLLQSCLTASRRDNKYEFAFDKVFEPSADQAVVFEEIAQLVQSALDGYNVCIFAYGQTGSGKTYTMEGGDVIDDQNKGMIPRAVCQIFQSTEELQSKGWMYEFEASFLEIYNETVRDLLGNGKDNIKHELKTAGQEVVVTNLTMVKVTMEREVHNLLEKASQNRSVAGTRCNQRSSRSHSVFRLKIVGKNSITSEECSGTLNLVDLAGSEKLKESGSEGQRLKETKAINSSLSSLGNVIMALANKDNHIPYRNSKLTSLLQHSLGGNSKTLMFVNVSPKEECFQETLNSLRFATKVNQCHIGTAQKKAK
ncbi:hypothetical protein FSP39_019513 [Pinctada imbricata]|uniref:Kinesin-like protein n=1 Tax=Pinctada imbricata TaxID=66713 RepID=A0AA88YRY3_PINIB|nr:hypothetical protein FSP39_019513 [Pinctada imbricata]